LRYARDYKKHIQKAEDLGWVPETEGQRERYLKSVEEERKKRDAQSANQIK
jgi:hypothetical protein